MEWYIYKELIIMKSQIEEEIMINDTALYIGVLLLGTAIGGIIEHFRAKSAYTIIIGDYRKMVNDYTKQKREMWKKIKEKT